jgi:hypothetical protein
VPGNNLPVDSPLISFELITTLASTCTFGAPTFIISALGAQTTEEPILTRAVIDNDFIA